VAAVTAQATQWIRQQFLDRVGSPYVYGGTWSPTDKRQGCDCSALTAHLANGLLYGSAMTYERRDPASGAWITTEAWRPIEVGQRGPFGTITVGSPAEIPADSPLKIALHHGPGGGANSHVWHEFLGMRAESAGSKGLCTGDRALSIHDPYGNDWAYLPAGEPPAATLPPPVELKPGDTGNRVARLQDGLRHVFPAYAGQLTLSGTYDDATAAAVREFQRRTGSEPTGVVDGRTADALARYHITLDGPAPQQPAAPAAPHALSDRELLVEIWEQLRGPGGGGWPQLARPGDTEPPTLVDAIGKLRQELDDHIDG
jgi:hypothetical protein